MSRAEKQQKRFFVPLVVLLTIPVVLLVVAVALGAYFGLVRTLRSTAMQSKETSADMLIRLNALSVMPAVVFGDEESMQRSVDDLAQNPEVMAVGLWALSADRKRVAGKPLVSFLRRGNQPLPRPESLARVRRALTGSFVVAEPVVDPDGNQIAVLGAQFSTKRETQAIAELSHTLWYASFGTALCLAAAIIIALTHLVVTPIRRLQNAAERLGRGEEYNLEHLGPIARVEDEVARLASSFSDMAGAVRDREQRLAIRNGELRLILDSVDQGFLMADPGGTLVGERSAIVEEWLGELPEGAKVQDLAAKIDPSSKAWVEMGWTQVIEGFLPLEMALAQLPSRLMRDGQHFDIAYHPVIENERLERIVIVLTDVTVEVERQRALAEQHEFSVLVDQFVRDRRAFFDFWNEANTLVQRIVEAAPEAARETQRRDIHTLKGNARFFDLSRLASLCHSLEDAMHERGEELLTEKEKSSLEELWMSLRRRIEPLISGATAFLEVSREEYSKLVDSVRNGQPHDKLIEMLEGLRYEPTEWRLKRAEQVLLSACRKLGKSPVQVEILHHDERLPPGHFDPFWSVFQHVLTNAIDHGLESDEERVGLNKPVPGTIVLSTRVTGGEVVVEVSDDGRGIDWNQVRQRAESLGLAARTDLDLRKALMSDGFTLRDSVSSTSGRGVGLSAIDSVVQTLHGKIEIESEFGRGSTWRFRLPAQWSRQRSVRPRHHQGVRVNQSPPGDNP